MRATRDSRLVADASNKLDLRFSLLLCDQEKQFRRSRRDRVMLAIKKLLALEKPGCLPSAPEEVPVIAIAGSGGGFRAMVGFSGVMKALYESGVLDCATYMSILYSHPEFPNMGLKDINAELMKRVNSNPLKLLLPQHITNYIQALWTKKASGQPVTFTDIFGMLIGETLLPARMDIKLSGIQEKIDQAQSPLPLFTCLHVKPDVSELMFAGEGSVCTPVVSVELRSICATSRLWVGPVAIPRWDSDFTLGGCGSEVSRSVFESGGRRFDPRPSPCVLEQGV
ncbi:Cytosolic phospholipase A2 [Liparis tanakae]|uniref:Cytosolic phospholipase A2 n=1 Tax=Liparis tanakae TaxID=230148 RepID=A0A4Z2ETV7_9TELE|nr:Cytosolic phospholipase A2 [Liparis tanakae]